MPHTRECHGSLIHLKFWAHEQNIQAKETLKEMRTLFADTLIWTRFTSSLKR